MSDPCGSGQCGCAGGAMSARGPVASVNGVALHEPHEALDADTLRQRACTELLRQAAVAAGLLDASVAADTRGIPDGRTSDAIEALLEQQLRLPEPDEAACRRHHAAHAERYVIGEQVRARHVLFAVTDGVDVKALRGHAEQVLVQLRAHHGDPAEAQDRFAQAARENSNCPSGRDGGELGWLTREDCAPEFARELFASREIGVLSRLVHSRFGLHVVEVVARRAGTPMPYESVREAVRQSLRQQAWGTALRHYLRQLAAQSQLVGVPLEATDAALVQ